MTHNVFGLCVRAGFGAQNCQPALYLNRSTKLQFRTSPRLTQNPCYMPLFFLSLCFQYIVGNGQTIFYCSAYSHIFSFKFVQSVCNFLSVRFCFYQSEDFRNVTLIFVSWCKVVNTNWVPVKPKYVVNFFCKAKSL